MHIETVIHKNLEARLIDEICIIKDDSWQHGMANQKKWLDENVAAEDIHLLIRNNKNNLIGYANFAHRNAVINQGKYQVFGLGNVCVAAEFKGKGIGAELMSSINNEINSKGYIVILHCKEDLESFYSKFGWEIIDRSLIVTEYNLDNIWTMIQGLNTRIDSLTIQGIAF